MKKAIEKLCAPSYSCHISSTSYRKKAKLKTLSDEILEKNNQFKK